MKKYLSMILTVALLATMMFNPVSANGGIIGELETDIQIQGLTEFNVRMLIGRYFSQRKAYLQGTSDTIDVVVTPMVTDEAAHRATLANAEIALVDSTVTIDTIAMGDDIALVTATETATFLVDGQTEQESVAHDIRVFMNSDGYLIINSDGYAETTTDFVSASYVDESALSDITAVGGSGPCVVVVAENEIGYTEESDGSTKYGEWYADNHGSEVHRTEAWCTMFVCWCAAQASVHARTIMRTARADDLALIGFKRVDQYTTGRYYPSAAQGGNYVPQPGDIIFEDGTYGSPGHAGIVRYVSGNVVYIIDGNAPDDGVRPDKVEYRTRSLTATNISGYGHPNYPYQTHYGPWSYDATWHTRTCGGCGLLTHERHEIVMINATQYGCLTCGYIRN